MSWKITPNGVVQNLGTTSSRKQGYDIELTSIKLRLIKYVINEESYVCGTTLLEERYVSRCRIFKGLSWSLGD